MDIWAWVDQLQSELANTRHARLAELIDLIPEYVCDNRHELVDGLIPEALALSRELDHAWLELFFRHWNLQSRILHRHQVKDYLKEAVELLDFANRPQTERCPQSVCATQDLANCYAGADGPGYVAERLAVAKETLDRITPAWPCFTCISAEYAAALLDDERPQEALDFLRAQTAALRRAGKQDDFRGTVIEALIQLGRFDEALELNERSESEVEGESFTEAKRIDQARILARLGRAEEAERELVSFELARRTHANYKPWADAVRLLGLLGVGNHHERHLQLGLLVDELIENGVLRIALELLEIQVELALHRGAPHFAGWALERYEALIPSLHRPLDAFERAGKMHVEIARAEAELAEGQPHERAPDGSALDGSAPDEVLKLLLLQRAQPDDEAVLLQLAELLSELGEGPRAVRMLKAFLEAQPEAVEVALTLARMLRAHSPEALPDYLTTLENSDHEVMRAHGLWMQAVVAFEAEAFAQARLKIEALLSAFGAQGGAPVAFSLRMRAQIHRRAGALEDALKDLDSIATAHPVGPWDWDRMVVATLLERWDAVRDSAARLEMEFEGEGPIDERLGIVQLDFGEGAPLYAERTGPVTATVVEIAEPGLRQHFGDRVVFDAAQRLNEAVRSDQPDQQDQQDQPDCFSVVAVREAGGFFSSVLAGSLFGEALESLREALREEGCVLQPLTGAGQTVVDEDGTERPGFCALIAIPGGKLEAIIACLGGGIENGASLVYPQLLARMGLSSVEHERRFARMFGV